MYASGTKLTFTNEMMKQSVTSFMIQNFDLKHGMMMSFKIHVSEHQVVHIGIFPDEETSNNFSEVTKQARKQIADMGVKAERRWANPRPPAKTTTEKPIVMPTMCGAERRNP